MSAEEFFRMFHKNAYLLWLLVAINIAGTLFGAYYYWDQLASTEWYFVLFVPDSPTATLLFASALALVFIRKESLLLNDFAYFGLIKVGLWTLFAMVLYKHFFFAPERIFYYGTLFVLHAGMIIEAFVLQDRLSFRLEHWLPVAGFYLMGDFLDYYAGIVPTPLPLDRPDLLVWLMAESVIVTLALAYYFYRGSLAGPSASTISK